LNNFAAEVFKKQNCPGLNNLTKVEPKINIQKIAIEIGDIIKWSSSVNEINRLGQATLKITKENFPNDSITSVRQQEIFNWLCSIGKTNLLADERLKLIVDFCLSIAGEKRPEIVKVLDNEGISPNILFREQLSILEREHLHPEVYKHAKGSFQYEKYAHAVLETCKAYDKAVQLKAGLSKFGRSLMQEAWSWSASNLKATTGNSDSDEKFHDGLKLLSEGVMAGVRNVTAHEPILDWPLKKEDCIDLLHLISFLYRQLDKSVSLKNINNPT
jgi:uncharacterized protein (TIGR02391 family)